MKEIISGIYAIENTKTKDVYIGSSKDILQRWDRHKQRLIANNHHSNYLQNAWNKYGLECFSFYIIELCDEQDLIATEQKHIDKIKPAYNMSPTAGRTFGVIRSDEYKEKQSRAQTGKVMSEETRRKISEGMKGKRNSLGTSRSFSDKVKEAIRNKLLGHVVSEETRNKISNKAKGYKHTDEAKKKIGEASKGNKYASRVMSDEEKKMRSVAYMKRLQKEKEDKVD